MTHDQLSLRHPHDDLCLIPDVAAGVADLQGQRGVTRRKRELRSQGRRRAVLYERIRPDEAEVSECILRACGGCGQVRIEPTGKVIDRIDARLRGAEVGGINRGHPADRFVGRWTIVANGGAAIPKWSACHHLKIRKVRSRGGRFHGSERARRPPTASTARLSDHEKPEVGWPLKDRDSRRTRADRIHDTVVCGGEPEVRNEGSGWKRNRGSTGACG